MVDTLLEPLQYAFMVRGLVAAIVVGIVCAVIGTYVVLRGMAFFGDALAHSILPGVAVGYLVSGGARESLFWWALAASLVASVAISAVSRAAKIKQDTAIGIIFAGMFALGVALISTVRSYTVDLTHFLFGDVLGVGPRDLILTIVFGLAIILMVIAFFKEFLILSFDPILAGTLRLPTVLLEYLLVGLIALAVVVSLQTVGVALMVAMLVTPAATGYLLSRRLSTMMLLAAFYAAFSAVVGLYLSYYLNIASGAAIVLTTTTLFGLTWLVVTIRQRRTIQAQIAEQVGHR
jgi:manganese/iron transport system permease protein